MTDHRDRYYFNPPEEARSFEEFVRRSNIEYFGLIGRSLSGVRLWMLLGGTAGIISGWPLILIGFQDTFLPAILIGLPLAVVGTAISYLRIRMLVEDVKRQREIKRLGRKWAALARTGKIPLTEEEADRREQAARARRASSQAPTAASGTPTQPVDPRGKDDRASGSPST